MWSFTTWREPWNLPRLGLYTTIPCLMSGRNPPKKSDGTSGHRFHCCCFLCRENPRWLHWCFGVSLLSLSFFPPFFLSFFWTPCRWFKLQTFPMGFHKGKVITDSHHREHYETPGWKKSNMKSLHHLFKPLVCIERTCFCMSDLFTAKTTITWSLYTPQKRSCKSETWSADLGCAPACQISCSSAWQVNKPKGCQRCQYGELRTGKPVLKTKSSS